MTSPVVEYRVCTAQVGPAHCCFAYSCHPARDRAPKAWGCWLLNRPNLRLIHLANVLH